jgi:SAP domain-containing ribonucleoprotein
MPEYGKKTVAELQEILKGRSLPHTGKKAELVARLNEADKTSEAPTST